MCKHHGPSLHLHRFLPFSYLRPVVRVCRLDKMRSTEVLVDWICSTPQAVKNEHVKMKHGGVKQGGVRGSKRTVE